LAVAARAFLKAVDAKSVLPGFPYKEKYSGAR
jgi:hypothetical protein